MAAMATATETGTLMGRTNKNIQWGCLFAGMIAFLFHISALSVSAQILVSSSAIPMTVSLYVDDADGMSSSAFDLSASGVKIRWFAGKHWIQSKSTDEGISIEFEDKRMPELKLQLGLYSAASFICDLSEEALARYLTEVERNFPDSKIQILNEGSFSPAVGAPPFISGYYRCLFFKVTDSNSQTEDQYICDLLTILPGGHFLVLREKGPQRAVTYTYSNLNSRLSEFVEL